MFGPNSAYKRGTREQIQNTFKCQKLVLTETFPFMSMFDLDEDLIPLIKSPTGNSKIRETPPISYTQVSSYYYHSMTINSKNMFHL